jgi:hypothetical protein
MDSLESELQRQGRFDEYFAWRAVQRPSPAQILKQLKSWGIKASKSAIYRLHSSGSALVWRVQEANKAKEALGKILPKDLEQSVRDALLRQRFDATLGDLTHKQLIDHLEVQIAEQKLELQERNLEHEKEKFKASLRTKLETGLEALYQEIKSNPKALEIYTQLKAVVAAK